MEKMIRIIERLLKEKQITMDSKVLIYDMGYLQTETVVAEIEFQYLKQKARHLIQNGTHVFEIE